MSDTFLRHALELLMIVPVSLYCVLPLRDRLQLEPWKFGLLAAFLEAAVVVLGALFCVRFNAPSIAVMMASLVLFFPLLFFTTTLPWPRLVFCFLLAIMLGVFCSTYVNFLTAPWELDNLLTFRPRSSLICLGLAFLLLLLFYRTLKVRLPYLLGLRLFPGYWAIVNLLCLLFTGLLIWFVPQDLRALMSGRIRAAGLAVMPLFPLAVHLYCYLHYRLMRSMTKASSLSQENDLLRMESKRFSEFNRYLEESRVLRHDFRQHLRVITELAQKDRKAELLEYLGQLETLPGESAVTYCANPAVDALAAHYAKLAAAREAVIDFALELPARLPLPEAELCALLGNLLDNSLRAVYELPPAARKITVICRMLSEKMLGLTVENPYTGKIRYRRDGLPASPRGGHGVGMSSVSATVHRYDGALKLSDEDGVFTVSLLLNV